MGASMSWLSGLLWAKKEIRILILGLVCATPPELLISELIRGVQDNAGKTTLLYRLKVRPLVYH
jgi:ADP-ribosylation factor-like protein 1